MAEYIEREVLLEDIENVCIFSGRPDHQNPKQMGARLVVQRIRFAPAADVAPVVHGRWVGLEYDGYADGCPVYDLWECSECGEEVRGEDVPTTHPWCHGCGARMDGAE